jgi:predicted anti-sigma-YlaC factor YlaD
MMKDVNRKDSYTKKISLWLDDELNPTEVTELKAHLAGCSTCRQTYEAMRRVDHLLRTAATVTVVPSSGFVERFEMRLVQYRPDKPWRIWLALGGLLLGTLFVFSTWAIVGGVALVGVSISLLDVGLLYQWLATFIESVDMLRVFLNLGSLFLKAGYIIMKQPLFWVAGFVALILGGIWVRVMQILSRRTFATFEFVF